MKTIISEKDIKPYKDDISEYVNTYLHRIIPKRGDDFGNIRKTYYLYAL